MGEECGICSPRDRARAPAWHMYVMGGACTHSHKAHCAAVGARHSKQARLVSGECEWECTASGIIGLIYCASLPACFCPAPHTRIRAPLPSTNSPLARQKARPSSALVISLSTGSSSGRQIPSALLASSLNLAHVCDTITSLVILATLPLRILNPSLRCTPQLQRGSLSRGSPDTIVTFGTSNWSRCETATA